jgi:hypothetical protein
MKDKEDPGIDVARSQPAGRADVLGARLSAIGQGQVDI